MTARDWLVLGALTTVAALIVRYFIYLPVKHGGNLQATEEELPDWCPEYMYREAPDGALYRAKVFGLDPTWGYPLTLNSWEEVPPC